MSAVSLPIDNEAQIVEKEKYYLNLPLWPEFAIHNKRIDGLIPSCRIDSWEDFDQVVKHYCDNDIEGNYVFRGQKHYTWQLEPTLDRLVNGAVTKDIAEKQLHNFRLSTRGRLNDKTILNSDSELWALGQHHGLATPLLDWSRSPYVALFFAFEGSDDPTWIGNDGESNNYSRTIFILNKAFIQDLNDSEGEDDGEILKIVEPSIDDYGRLVNQAGLFTFAPYGEILESALEKHLDDSDVDIDDVQEVSKYICRIHIPNEPDTRNNCLKKLHKMNIHHASLFPDLIGASGYCNDLIREALTISKQRNEFESDQLSERGVPKTTFSSSASSHNLEPITTKMILLQSLIIDESIKGKIPEKKLMIVVDELLSFINEKASVDWYKRDPILARLRNIIRRTLKKQGFPENYIDRATKELITKASELSKEVEKMKLLNEHD